MSCKRGAALRLTIVLAAASVMCSSVAVAVEWPWLRKTESPPVYPEVTVAAEWLSANLRSSSVSVLDARPTEAYESGHIPGAVSVPASSLGLERVGSGEIGSVLGDLGLTGRGRVVCYGDATLDENAALLFWALDIAGAEAPAVLEGGLDAWSALGYGIDSGEESLPPVTWTGAPRPRDFASAAYVALVFGVDGHEIVDTRGWEQWSGEAPADGASGRAGHVPHALPYDFTEFQRSDGTLLPPEETRQIFSRFGPRPSNPVDLDHEFIVHGAGGPDGALGFFLLRRAGVERLRYFPAGWGEWARDVSLPVVRIVGAEELVQRVASSRRWLRPDAPPEGFLLFDVRHWGDYASGHIPGSVGLPSTWFADSLDVYVDRHWPEIDRASTPVVTYCYGSNCIRSRNTATEAARGGFVRVERFYEGVSGWRLAGGDLLRDERRLELMREERERMKRAAEARRAEEAAAESAAGASGS